MIYTSLQAGINQLHVSLYLFVKYRDPASVHTLASAAEGIFRGLIKNKNNSVQQIDDRINHEYLDRIHGTKNSFYTKYLHKHRNFLKHANNNIVDSVDVCDELNALMIFRASLFLKDLSNEIEKLNRPEFLDHFFYWMYFQEPNLFKINIPHENLNELRMISDNRSLFFKEFILHFERLVVYPSNSTVKS